MVNFKELKVGDKLAQKSWEVLWKEWVTDLGPFPGIQDNFATMLEHVGCFGYGEQVVTIESISEDGLILELTNPLVRYATETHELSYIKACQWCEGEEELGSCGSACFNQILERLD